MSKPLPKPIQLPTQRAATTSLASAPADSYKFVNVNEFTPNNEGWTSIGNIATHSRNGNVFTLTAVENAVSTQISFLSATCFRVRFNPAPNFDYSVETSRAVVNRNLGQVNLNVLQDDDQAIVVDTGKIKVEIQLQPYRILVYRGNQLINADPPGKNLVYIPGQEVIANFKVYPGGARYFGFGEKAGVNLLKNEHTMTFFNYDNYMYSAGHVPASNEGGPLNDSEALYCSVPLLMENNPAPPSEGDYAGDPYSYGLFFDNPAQSYINIGTNDYSDMTGKYYFGALYGDMDYYFMAGDDTADVIQQYTTLTGRPPLPPKYVFGYHQGCYGYYDRDILEGVADAYREARIPIDGLHIDVDFQDNYRTFTSSKKKFPDVAGMMAGLHSRGFKCSTNITPLLTDNEYDENGDNTPYTQRDALLSINPTAGLIYNTRAGEGINDQLYQGQVNYGVNKGSNPYLAYPPHPQDGGYALNAYGNYPDFGRADVRQAWGEQYSYLIKDVGLDMVWQDMTCPAIKGADSPDSTFPLALETNNGTDYVPNAKMHNAYVLMLLQATWEGVNILRPDKRNFIIARGGYAGMQRYAGLWTGDSASTWEFLRINIPEVLNLGLSGIPISGCDIGGFANPDGGSARLEGEPFHGAKVVGGVTDYELLTRWMTVGSFLPWYRNHYDGYNKQFQEPYAYGEPVPTNCRKFVELRYRMLQLYYDAMYQATQTGLPIARALFLNDPQDPRVYDYLNDQFFIGRDFLVAPITQPGTGNPPVATRSVYLPAGSQWYAFKDNQAPLDAAVEGGTLLDNWVAALDQAPIYVRAGAILPFRELEQYVGELSENPLTFNIYPGQDSTYSLYQDDGVTTQAELNQTYRLTEISHQGISGGQNVRVQRVFDQYTPPEKFYYIALLGTRAPSSITLDNAALPNVGDPDSLAASDGNAYYWNDSLQITFIKVFDNQSDLTVTAMYL
ncbi:MAG TPA: TIM-barrel domain-containing protein [Archangium sp.]|uniref:TIM-barrel domain-containing protein n=1 Tax=Archangium sp. TaxID=1872627 RepID=UPI002ED9E4A6